MEYYYTPKENISEHFLIITGDEAKHLCKVLRKKPGEEIYVTDGEKNLYKTKIENTSKDKIECRITGKFFDLNELKMQIYLYQSLLKNPARFEFVIEKATELGVHEINPIVSETVINKERNKSERWQSIAMAAMKQSQRCYLPVVKSPQEFTQAIKSCTSDIKIIAHEKSNTNSRNLTGFKNPADLYSDKSIAIFIGPEGGFTDIEIEIAAANGFQILNLGNRKYRSETAAIVVMSLLSAG